MFTTQYKNLKALTVMAYIDMGIVQRNAQHRHTGHSTEQCPTDTLGIVQGNALQTHRAQYGAMPYRHTGQSTD